MCEDVRKQVVREKNSDYSMILYFWLLPALDDSRSRMNPRVVATAVFSSCRVGTTPDFTLLVLVRVLALG